MNRLRLRFIRGEEIKFISHLDMVRLWQRVFRRSGIEICYSEGYNPHPRLSIAAPLALGVTGSNELMDVYLREPLAETSLICMIRPQMPVGLGIKQVFPIPLDVPTLQSQIRFAEYEAKVSIDEENSLEGRVESLLDCQCLPWEHLRDTGVKSYDLRLLINSVWIDSVVDGVAGIGMRLQCDSNGAGRPEQVIKALGLDAPLSIHRSRIILHP
ncbi:MAG: TIGR03936 family radical SAM-associated protein [Dehalococcoidia bacterium]|nr:TIGR03936 family radical SAM-associated protein [Dehalococcoidia bacterium]